MILWILRRFGVMQVFIASGRQRDKFIAKHPKNNKNWSLRTKKRSSKENDHEGTRTLNLPIRSPTPYPLGHAARCIVHVGKLIRSLFITSNQFREMNCFLKQTRVNKTMNSNHTKQVLFWTQRWFLVETGRLPWPIYVPLNAFYVKLEKRKPSTGKLVSKLQYYM